MKVIFSRKGIDDAYGKGASPLFPNGQLLSIPIPVRGREKGFSYKEIQYSDMSYQRLIRQLEIPIKRSSCHFDPDLNAESFKRSKLWKPCLGHHGAAAQHLFNQGVDRGDLFLFFGSFREVKLAKYKQWRFVKNSAKRHILFGFLKIGAILDLKVKTQRERAIELGYADHPHVQNDYPHNNVLFIAEDGSTSAGLFEYAKERVLSQDGASKSIWELPSFFFDLNISRHAKRERFSLACDKTILKTVGIGQEFVVEENSQVTQWANSLLIDPS